MSKRWTEFEHEYLAENRGTKSLPTIAKNFSRSENAVKIKAFKLRLGAFLENGDYITPNQLFTALGINGGKGYKMKSWVENRGMPVKNKKVNKCSFKIIYLEDFWEWAERHKHFIDFARLEWGTLGIEPEWMRDVRRAQEIKRIGYHATPWMAEEDERLKALVKLQRYGYAELSKLVGRSCGAVQRRLVDLGVKDRPIKADNTIRWDERELGIMKEGILSGCSYEHISVLLGYKRSAKAVRGLVGRYYGTENLDKARTVILGRDCEKAIIVPTGRETVILATNEEGATDE